MLPEQRPQPEEGGAEDHDEYAIASSERVGKPPTGVLEPRSPEGAARRAPRATSAGVLRRPASSGGSGRSKPSSSSARCLRRRPPVPPDRRRPRRWARLAAPSRRRGEVLLVGGLSLPLAGRGGLDVSSPSSETSLSSSRQARASSSVRSSSAVSFSGISTTTPIRATSDSDELDVVADLKLARRHDLAKDAHSFSNSSLILRSTSGPPRACPGRSWS